MKKVQNCETENCIPTLSSCVEWNGGSIEFLGICDGDSLNNLVWEIVTKLEEIAGDDLSQFDIDSLLDICNQQAPLEVTIISILTLLKNNQVCLKDFIDTLNERLNELFENTGVTVNLKCYAQFDNLGNSLSITREQLDQLIIDNLCNHKQRIESLEGAVVSLQSQIDNINSNTTVEELSFGTCVNPSELPTSTQVINTSNAFCDLEEATGDSTDIASALSNTPSDLNAEFGLITGWILVPTNWAENYNNLLLEVENLRQRILFMEANCCALSCDDIELGFSAVYNEDLDGIIITFSFGAGTNIPAGFEDGGSYGTITDIDGNSIDFNIEIANNATEEIAVAGLNLTAPLTVDITAVLTTGSLTCQKCLKRTVAQANCKYCEYTATGSEGATITLMYEATQNYSSDPHIIIVPTTTSTTTTTTSGV
jgi:hypothetical protein